MGSVTVLDKSDVLSGLFGTWDSLDVLLGGLSEQQWQTPTPLPGWCVHNVVAHIVGTESVLQGLSSPDADFDASTLDHVRNDVGIANEAWVRHLSTESGAALHERFRSITADRRQRLTTCPSTTGTHRLRHRLVWRVSGDSCEYGSSTAGCTSRTSATA